MNGQISSSLESLTQGPYKICITSFLARTLIIFGKYFNRKKVRNFLQYAAKDVEIFLPFYKWFDVKKEVRSEIVNEFRKVLREYGMSDLRSFHAGYSGQGFLLTRFYMNPSDPRMVKENTDRLKREIGLIGKLRQEFHIDHPIIFVLHCGRKEKGIGREESILACISVLKAVLKEAEDHGVCLSVENVFSEPGQEEIGTVFSGLRRIIQDIGQEWVEKGVLGCTLDPAHALLTYSGNYDAIEKDLVEILPFLVHIHVNHPRTAVNRAGKIFTEWSAGNDDHTAPVKIPERNRYWSFLGKAIQGSKISKWRTLTYEVNWAVPIFRVMFGGSNIDEVRIGWQALDRFCNHPTEAFDVPAIERYIDAQLAKVR